MLDILLFYAILASVFTFGKQIVNFGQPFFVCALRLIPAGMILFFTSYFFEKNRSFFKREHISALLGLVLFVFFMDVFRFLGLQYVSSSYASLLGTLSPFIATILSYYLYREKISFKKLMAMLLGVLAVLPVIINNLQATHDNSPWYLLIGYSALFISTTAVVVRSYFLKDLVNRHGYSISLVLGTTYLAVGSLSLSISACTETWSPFPVSNFSEILPLILFITIFYSLFAQPLFARLVKKYPITLITFFILSTPLITALLQWIFYGKPPEILFLGSCLILGLAFMLFSNEERKEHLLT